jgi:hypothetical protein
MNAKILEELEVGVIGGGVIIPSLEKSGQIVQSNYGTMSKGLDSTFFIVVSPTENQLISNVVATSSCGCVVTRPKKVGTEYLISIKYDTKRVGEIRKTVSVAFNLNGTPEKIFFKLIGKVEVNEI